HLAELRAVKLNGERRRRIVAVVLNNEGREEACVFVLKRRVGSPPVILDVLPVFSDFRLSVSQSKPVDPQARPTAASRSDFSLRLSSDLEHTVKLETSMLDTLQSLLIEIKRVMAIAQQNGYSRATSHSWISHYEDTSSATIVSPENDRIGGSTDIGAATVPAIMANPFLTNATSSTDLKSIKDAWAAKELRAREKKFAEFENRKIFVGSWNVNGQLASQSLTPWLETAEDEQPVIYVLGFQELDLSTEAYIYSDTGREGEWAKAIDAAFEKTSCKYVKKASKQLVGMLIVLYVRAEEQEAVKEVSAEYVPTGLLGMMGNKGGTAIRFRFYDSYFSFVNSHLAADTSMVERRNQDFQEIRRRLAFPLPAVYADYTAYTRANPWVTSLYDCAAAVGVGAPGAVGTAATIGKTATSIYDVDHLFWMGDLNYRVPLPDTEAKALLAVGDLAQMLKFDQLSIEQNAGRVFGDFLEGPIKFEPTYKYDIGTSRFDSSEKRRSPSFCDRILWFRNPLRSHDPDWLRIEWYRSSMAMTLSDHKPIMGLYTLKVRKLDPVKLQAVHDDIYRDLDKFENESYPDLSIDQNVLDFGDVRFKVPVARILTVENKGQVMAQYRFVPKGNDKSLSKPWCYVNPPFGTLMPGETVKVTITILVDSVTAPSINFGIENLDDILILHTENGKDHFVSISGNWMASAFGSDLSVLTRLVRPIREHGVDGVKAILKASAERKAAKRAEIADADASGAVTPRMNPEGIMPTPPVAANEQGLSIPKEMWRLVDFIYRFGMDVDNLFLSSGDQAITEYLRECLDTGVEFDLSALLSDPAAPPAPEPESLSPPPDDKVSADASRTSIDLDVDLLLQTNTLVRETSLLELGSGDIPPSSAAVRPPRPRGRAAAVHSAAETLVAFLQSLVEPVVPPSMYMRCVTEGYLTFVAARAVVQHLPAVNYNAFVYLASFLREVVVGYKGRGELSADKLAQIFAPIILRPQKDPSSTSHSSPSAIPARNKPLPVAPAPRPPTQKYSTLVGLSTAKPPQPPPATSGPPSRPASAQGTGAGTGAGASAEILKGRMFLAQFLEPGNEL
ncbi:Endonuclease/exonuclease/phosphatase, partial [Blyttiomyces helicus]